MQWTRGALEQNQKGVVGITSLVLTLMSLSVSEASSRTCWVDTETCRREGEGRSGPAVHLGTYGCACAMCVTDAIGEMRSLGGGRGGGVGGM